MAEHVVLQARSQAEAFLGAHPQGLTLDNLKAMLKQANGEALGRAAKASHVGMAGWHSGQRNARLSFHNCLAGR